jgi:hypothetical protein
VGDGARTLCEHARERAGRRALPGHADGDAPGRWAVQSFRVDAACAVGDQKGDEVFTFAVLGDRLYWSWAGKTAVLDRCPARQ